MKTQKWDQGPKSGRRTENKERKMPSYTKKGPGRFAVFKVTMKDDEKPKGSTE
jgi:hypothetical protein